MTMSSKMLPRTEELKFRIDMCKFCIEVLEKEKDDPRQPEALDHYRNQLADLERKYVEASRPPDIVVSLKPAIISANVPK